MLVVATSFLYIKLNARMRSLTGRALKGRRGMMKEAMVLRVGRAGSKMRRERTSCVRAG